MFCLFVYWYRIWLKKAPRKPAKFGQWLPVVLEIWCSIEPPRRNVATPSKNVLGKGSPEKPSALVTKTPEKGLTHPCINPPCNASTHPDTNIAVVIPIYVYTMYTSIQYVHLYMEHIYIYMSEPIYRVATTGAGRHAPLPQMFSKWISFYQSASAWIWEGIAAHLVKYNKKTVFKYSSEIGRQIRTKTMWIMIIHNSR